MDTDERGLRLLRRCAPRNDILGLWVGLFLWGAVAIQVNGQQYASQDGHALDANPGIGTFGLNRVQRFDPLMPRVNLYITGNVRGGGRFQGLIPYRSVQELNLNLGSGTLSDFRRDSTGSLDLGRGVGGAVRPWVDASRQVTRSSGGSIINTYRVHQQPRGVHPALERGGGNTRLAVRPFSLRDYSLNVDAGSDLDGGDVPANHRLGHHRAVIAQRHVAADICGRGDVDVAPQTHRRMTAHADGPT